MTDGLTDVDLRPAFEAVREDPESRHSLDTSLAPVYEAIRTADDRRVDEMANLLDRYLPLAETLVEVGCGPGELLGHQEAVDTFVGVESSPDLLGRAARRVPVVRGDPRSIPAVDVDAIAAFGYLTAEFDRPDLRSFVTSALGSLAPGGTLLFDVPLSARAFDAADFEVTDGGVSVRRTVEVDGGGETVRARDRYELIDRLGDETVTTEVVRECRIWDVGTVWDVVHDAGFESVVISSGDVEPGAALVVAASETEVS
ncbi:MAG: SAM-dependent methyltransferase [Natronomonas sp.]|jgi:SAM-dependent methyltransferase